MDKFMYAKEYDMLGEYTVKVDRESKTVTRMPDPEGAPDVVVSQPLSDTLQMYWIHSKQSAAKGRKIPFTKRECEMLFRYKDIKEIIKLGLLKEDHLWLVNGDKKKEMRACALLTEVGRQYCRSNYEEVSSNAGGAGSPSAGSLNGDGESVGGATV
jgi:hypothetical protein